MNKLVLLLTLSLSQFFYSQSYTDTVKFDRMEDFDWNGNWYFSEPTTGFFTNASKSAPTSAVIYGTGGGTDEYDWYSLPNITGLDPFKEYKIQINLGAYRFTSTGGSSGVDASDYVEVQISTDGGSNYSSELRVTGFNNAYWDYNSQIASVNVDGNLDIFTPAGGGNRTLTGDGYSVLELILPFGTTQVAVDILSLVDRPGEEWWIDDIYLLGSVNNPLPVELIYFRGEQKNDYNILSWSTMSESNSDAFDVEWSIDAYEWNLIDSQTAAGNSNTQQYYSCVQMNPLHEINYYRLIQRDWDGNFEIFGPIYVDNRQREKEVVRYLNISGQEINPSYFSGIVIIIYKDGTLSREYLK